MNIKQQQALCFSDVPMFMEKQTKVIEEREKSEEVRAANPKDL